MEEQILELTRQVTILNERLPNHITWTEKNVRDHEARLRTLESENAQMKTQVNSLLELLTRVANLERKVWIAVGIMMAFTFTVQLIQSLGV